MLEVPAIWLPHDEPEKVFDVPVSTFGGHDAFEVTIVINGQNESLLAGARTGGGKIGDDNGCGNGGDKRFGKGGKEGKGGDENGKTGIVNGLGGSGLCDGDGRLEGGEGRNGGR